LCFSACGVLSYIFAWSHNGVKMWLIPEESVKDEQGPHQRQPTNSRLVILTLCTLSELTKYFFLVLGCSEADILYSLFDKDMFF